MTYIEQLRACLECLNIELKTLKEEERELRKERDSVQLALKLEQLSQKFNNKETTA